MGQPPTTAEGADARQNQADSLREAIADAYSFVEGQKTTQTFAAITPEDLYDQFINRVSGPDTPARPNALNRITNILNNVTSAIQQIQKLPDNAFRSPDDYTSATANDNVNTPPNTTGV